ncbi:MAG: gentisate 1,2-dioxygenase [Acetobacteraceae bacterium]
MDGSNTHPGLQSLYAEMEPHSLYPLWEVLHGLVTPTPQSAAAPHLWSYAPARDYLLRAGDLITAEQAERRVLILENPALRGTSAAVPSLYAGLQLILPGEIAPAHRHSQCALRFVMEGDGAHTAVDGERAVMRPFDLVLTPNWQWHDHGNETTKPMIWLDGLDVPTVRHFETSFAERLPESAQAQAVEDDQSYWLYGRGLRPFRGSTADRRPARQPLFHYPYQDWRESLAMLARSAAPDPHLGHALEFNNPADGGPIMPTIAAHVRLVPAGFRTQPRRATDGTVFVVVEGAGSATIDGRMFTLHERDIVVLPSWNELVLQADRELVLFGFSDRAAQEKLSLFREHRA